MSFALYMIGFALLIGGVAWAMVLAGVAPTYVAVACVILAGIGVITGVSRARTKDISQ